MSIDLSDPASVTRIEPILVTCRNCGREILLTRKHADPGTYVPRERIHHVFMFERSPFTAFCVPCQHFTVFAPEAPNNVS